MPFYLRALLCTWIHVLSTAPPLLCTHIHPSLCPTFPSLPFICTLHISPHLSRSVSSLTCSVFVFFSVHAVTQSSPSTSNPPACLSLRNPTHFLSLALSWGLINLLKSQSAFHSITITPYPGWCSLLGGIMMITFRIQSVFLPVMASSHSSNITMQWWRTRPLLRSEQIES